MRDYDSALNSNYDDFTPEQLKVALAQRERTIEGQRRRIREVEDEKQQLRFVLKGMCLDRLELKVTISPEMLDQRTLDVVQFLVSNHAKAAAHEIEQKMGAPLQRLRDALLHINYLENHVSRWGVPFAPFGLKEQDRKMMDSY